LEDLRDVPRRKGTGGRIRRRVLVLCVLPTLLLGATYFLLVEFALREVLEIGEVPLLLRVGGGVLALLFALVALGCGSLLADGFLRPLRALLRIAESQDITPGPTSYLSDPDSHVRRLFLRVLTLVQQNRSGAQALRELEALRNEVHALRETVRSAAAASIIPSPVEREAPQSGGELTAEMERLWTRFRADLSAVEDRLDETSQALAAQEKGRKESTLEMDTAILEIERFGTVWSLELERARRCVPTLPGALGSCFSDFSNSMQRLRDASRLDGGGLRAIAEARNQISRVREIVGGWLHDDPQAGKTESGPR